MSSEFTTKSGIVFSFYFFIKKIMTIEISTRKKNRKITVRRAEKERETQHNTRLFFYFWPLLSNGWVKWCLNKLFALECAIQYPQKRIHLSSSKKRRRPGQDGNNYKKCAFREQILKFNNLFFFKICLGTRLNQIKQNVILGCKMRKVWQTSARHTKRQPNRRYVAILLVKRSNI